MGREVHVKDESRFPGKWAFFGFDDTPTAKMFSYGDGVLFVPRATRRGYEPLCSSTPL